MCKCDAVEYKPKYQIDARTEKDMDQYIERKISHFLNGNDQSEKRLAELNSEVSSAVKLFRAS